MKRVDRIKNLKTLIKENEVFNEESGTKLIESNGVVSAYAFCDKCRKWKPVSNFYYFNGFPISACKQCRKEYNDNHKNSLKSTIEELNDKVRLLEEEKKEIINQVNLAEKNKDSSTEVLTVLFKAIQSIVQSGNILV